MKFIIALAMVLVICSAYESYWDKGDKLLDQLQNGNDEIFVVTFYNPTPVKDDYSRQAENNRVQDELQSEVLNKLNAKPLKIRYASADSTDRDNANLLYKAGVKEDLLTYGPVVLVTRKGFGNIVWGPTVIHQVETFVKGVQAEAKKEAEAAGNTNTTPT